MDALLEILNCGTYATKTIPLRIPLFTAMLLTAISLAANGETADEYRARVGAQNQAMLDDAIRQQVESTEKQDSRFDGVKDLESFIKIAKEDRQQQVNSLYNNRESIRAAKSGNAGVKRKQIEGINRQIETVNDPLRPHVPEAFSSKVITLADSNENPHYLKVTRVVDESNAIMVFVNSQPRPNREFWLAGSDTSGWVDGQKVHLDGLLLATGTKSYATTNGGQRTITKMELIDLKAHDDEFTRRDEVRTWTNKNGDTRSGVLVLYDAGKVTIKSLDGEKTVLLLNDLDDDDVAYVGQNAPTPKSKAKPGK